MKKIVTRFLALALIASMIISPAMAASLPNASAKAPATSEPGPGREEVKKAIDGFNSLSHKEKKSRFKEVKKLYKEYRTAKKAHRDDEDKSCHVLAVARGFSG